jgi:hypothetical protein
VFRPPAGEIGFYGVAPDVRMVDRRKEPRLALEPRAATRIGQPRGRQDFDLDFAAMLLRWQIVLPSSPHGDDIEVGAAKPDAHRIVAED